MASIKELFNVEGYSSEEARKLAIEAQCTELQTFVKGLRNRKAQVFTSILKMTTVTFDALVTFSSLLLQANLYCRKTHSMMLLKQLFASELSDAISAYYSGDYAKTAEYLFFIKQVFECFID